LAKLTKKKVEKAIILSYGIISDVARRCKVNRPAIYEFLAKYPELETLRSDMVEAALDLSEGKLISKIKRGQDWAIKYHLSTKGTSRGYGKKLEIKDKTINLDKIFDKLQQDPNREPYLRRLMTEDPEKVLLEYERVSIQS
jgi:AcrR family transcriptional regulator